MVIATIGGLAAPKNLQINLHVSVPDSVCRAPNPALGRSSSKLGGMLIRKERWGLSWRGRVLMAGWGLVLGIHPFQAVTHRVPAHVLVVEGWVCWPKRSQNGRFTPSAERRQRICANDSRCSITGKFPGRQVHAAS